MRNIKCTYFFIALLTFSAFTLALVNAQSLEYTNYLIKPDGSIEPNNGAIIHNGNNYFLTQNISGTVTIQKDDAVFDGAGYAVTGNAVKGTYNLSESVLYLDAGFNLTNGWNATVQNVKILNNVNGIALINSYYCRILNCTIIGNAVDGIKIYSSANNSIVWNEIVSNSDDAIQLINSGNNSIMANNMNPGTEYRDSGNGLQFNGNCSNNKIEGNNVVSFWAGIYMDGSNVTENIVSYNNFTNNQYMGAAIMEGSHNTIKPNNFYSNNLTFPGDNDCSGNYWDPRPLEFYDSSPLDAPVNTTITPLIIQIPQPLAPTPTSTSTPTTTSTSTATSSTATPTPFPKNTSTTTPTPNSPTPTSTEESNQSPSNLPMLWIIAAVVSVVVILSVSIVVKERLKGTDKLLKRSA